MLLFIVLSRMERRTAFHD